MTDRRRARDAERREHRITVYLDSEELQRIERVSETSRLPKGVFLRRVGLGSVVKPVLDPAQVRELIEVRAELGRVGGALNRWIRALPAEAATTAEVRQMLEKIEGVAEEVRSKVRAL